MGIFALTAEKYNNVTLYVTGHAPYDFDSLASAYLVGRWLSRVGCHALPVLPDTVAVSDSIPGDVMRLHGVDVTCWTRAAQLDVGDGAVVLVDCHTSCIPGSIAAVIDHHPTSGTLPVSEKFCFNRTASSCALAAYRLALADGIEATDDEEILVVRSVYMDTQSLLSAKFDPADRPWLDEMIKKHSLDEDELRRRGLCFADLSRPPEELAADGLKYYAIAGKRCASTHIQAENIPEDLIDKAVRHLAERRRNEGVDIWVFFIAEPLSGRSRVIELSDSGVVERRYDRFLSRSKDIIPDLERRLLSGLDFR